MAYTIVKSVVTVWGNKQVRVLQVTADAASGVIDTGLGVVDEIAGIVPVSMATAAIKLRKNLSAASAAANGQIMVSSAVSGDVFTVTAVGR